MSLIDGKFAKDTNVPSNDCISRQVAIDVLALGAEILRRVLDDTNVVGVDREKYEWGLKLIEADIADIRELPSAQPYTDEEIQKMQDMEQAEIEKAYELGREDAKAEIVRCNDCKHYTFEPGPNSVNCYVQHCTRSVRVSTSPDEFCSRAERRTDEPDNQTDR